MLPVVFSSLMAMNTYAHDISAPATAARMVAAAEALLAALTPAQRSVISFSFEDRRRYDWHYVPRTRDGLLLENMTPEQRTLAFAFMEAGLSPKGYWKAVTITRLETVLAEIETGNPMSRNPQKYAFSFFGQPSESGTWGWRVEGHHLSLNFTIVNGHLFASAPRFLGANPAEVAHGELAGVRTLSGEEYLARELIKSMNDEQLAKAVFSRRAYRDIVTGSAETVSPLDPVGITAAELNRNQKDLLGRLIDEYVSALPPEIARQRMAVIRAEDPDRIRFGWAGGLEAGRPHYYRLQGRHFLIEYDNVQNGANHVHTVWRDFEGDFGRDLLRQHYRADQH